MPRKQSGDLGDVDVVYSVDDEVFDELVELTGTPVAGITLWEDSITDVLSQGELAGSAVDVDLYLAGGVYFELYGVLCFPDLDSEPLSGVEFINQRMARLVEPGLYLQEVAVDEEDSLVLILGRKGRTLLFLNAGAWALGEWEELPEHALVPAVQAES